MVMKADVPSSSGISTPSAATKDQRSTGGNFWPVALSMYSRPRPGISDLRFWESVTHLYWTEQTDSTSGTRRLNSSKQPQEPEAARPLKMSPIVR